MKKPKPKTRLEQFLRAHPNIKRKYLADKLKKSPSWITRLAGGGQRILQQDMQALKREIELIVGRKLDWSEIVGTPTPKEKTPCQSPPTNTRGE